MSRSNKNRVKHKNDSQVDPLFKRWQQDPYGTILKKIKEEKQVSKKTPILYLSIEKSPIF